MNGRQAAKLAAQRVAELERILALNKRDIVDYNLCIMHMMDHGSPCDFCEGLDECKGEGRDVTIGCERWILRFPKAGDPDGQEAGSSDNSVQRVEEQG